MKRCASGYFSIALIRRRCQNRTPIRFPAANKIWVRCRDAPVGNCGGKSPRGTLPARLARILRGASAVPRARGWGVAGPRASAFTQVEFADMTHQPSAEILQRLLVA